MSTPEKHILAWTRPGDWSFFAAWLGVPSTLIRAAFEIPLNITGLSTYSDNSSVPSTSAAKAKE